MCCYGAAFALVVSAPAASSVSLHSHRIALNVQVPGTSYQPTSSKGNAEALPQVRSCESWFAGTSTHHDLLPEPYTVSCSMLTFSCDYLPYWLLMID